MHRFDLGKVKKSETRMTATASMFWNQLQTHESFFFKCLFNVRQHAKQIFKVRPFVKWHNNTWEKRNGEKWKVTYLPACGYLLI